MLQAGVGLLLMPAIRPATEADRAAIRPATEADRSAIQALLIASALPAGDLDDAPISFLVAADDDGLAGVVGIEACGDTGLLRSLAVVPARRGSGLGHALVEAAEAHARERGLGGLVLLTTTAAPFFGRRGYRDLPRDAAPAAVRATAEFRSICPASATCMAKSLEAAA